MILPVADAFVGSNVMFYYRKYDHYQWLHKNDLLVIQRDSLLDTIKVAYREVPFYRDIYNRYGVCVDDIKDISDLSSLPQIFKKDLKINYPDRCTRETGQSWKEFCTSGSSGSPFTVRVDKDSLSRSQALMLLRANYSGWDIGDPYVQTGMTLDRGFIKLIKDRILRVQYVSAFDLSDEKLDSFLLMITKNKIKYVMGYASSLYCLAKRAESVGSEIHLNGVVSWGDNMYSHYRSLIERIFMCRVTDTYGCGEGIQIAAQCGRKDGFYHIFMPHVVVEIVDDNGIPVPDGTLGHIVLTRLDPGTMPLIRYRVGDLGIKSREVSCSCGRGLELLERVEGRDTDVVLTPNGNRLIVHFFTGILEYYDSIDTFKVVQNEVGMIKLYIVVNTLFKEEHLKSILDEISNKGDPNLLVETEIVDDIPLEKSNKRRFVVSNLPSDIRVI